MKSKKICQLNIIYLQLIVKEISDQQYVRLNALLDLNKNIRKVDM